MGFKVGVVFLACLAHIQAVPENRATAYSVFLNHDPPQAYNQQKAPVHYQSFTSNPYPYNGYR